MTLSMKNCGSWPPNPACQAYNAWNASVRIVKAVASGHKVLVSEVERQRRLDICRKCEFFKDKGNGMGRCKKCGCHCKGKGWIDKVRYTTENCPIHKW